MVEAVGLKTWSSVPELTAELALPKRNPWFDHDTFIFW
jgi:hypothetical protein